MKISLSDESLRATSERLAQSNQQFVACYPGESGRRQPVHTVYGGAHLFRADSAPRLGQVAQRSLNENAPDFAVFARAVGLPLSDQLPDVLEYATGLKQRLENDPEAVRGDNKAAWLAHTIYARVQEKLQREPVEDFRIDFEDGYGNRPDAEEDGHAESAAAEVAAGANSGTLPPFIGIRIKNLGHELRDRALRTAQLFIGRLVKEAGGRLPANFVVTLPKITARAQVSALADAFDALEAAHDLPSGSLRMELMVETPYSIFDDRGAVALPGLIQEGRGRVVAAHFGTYDYTASLGITAAHQHMRHAVCDFARGVMQVALAGRDVWMSDGATNVLPVPVHRAAAGHTLTAAQATENRSAVHRAWRHHYDDIRHSLINGFYQGWDLHPAQLVTRYAAVYAFFLESLDAASERLLNFIAKAAQATLV